MGVTLFLLLVKNTPEFKIIQAQVTRDGILQTLIMIE